jgi:hypothetical protein
MERYGEGWQSRHKSDLAASWKGGTSGGGGFIHVPGQVGTYAQYLRMGGPEKGVGTANIMAGGRMAAYRSGVRLAGSPIRAPITYTSIRGGAPVFLPTESLKGGEAFMPLPGSPIFSFGGASTGLAAGGSALARGGPSVGTLPGGGVPVAAGGGAGGGLSTALTGGLGGISSGIMGTVTQYLPLAIKVILAVIVVKIVLWVVRGKK